jgi:hypothetical protein
MCGFAETPYCLTKKEHRLQTELIHPSRAVLIHISQSVLDALDMVAHREGIPRLAVIRHALAEYTAAHPAITRLREERTASEMLREIVRSA